MAVAAFANAARAATAVTYFGNDPEFSTNGTAKRIGYKIFDGNSIAFNFSTLAFSSVTSFVLDLFFKKTANTGMETWTGKITGTNAGGAGTLISLPGYDQTTMHLWSTTLNPLDAGFAAAQTDKLLKVAFNDTNTLGTDKFFLQTSNDLLSKTDYRTRLTINYLPAVPLPAGGVLLLTGLGGLFMARRRKA